MTPALAERAPAVLDVQMIPLEQLLESKMNTRRHHDPAAMAELEASIRQVGVLTPLIARPYTFVHGPDDPFFELAAGHRRFRAAKAAGVAAVPVRVMALDDDAFRHILIIENLQRQDIHPLDEADGYQALMRADKAYTVEAIAAKVGKSPSYVYKRLKLTNLGHEARLAWDADEITAAHAERLARLSPEEQEQALPECWHPLYRAREEGGPQREPAPLSQLEHWIEKHTKIAPGATETAYYFPEIAAQIDAEEEPATLLQLSESHMPGADLGTKKHGILGQGRWTRITGPKNRCANVEKGVVVHGGPMRVLEVCATKGCPKHHPPRKAAPVNRNAKRQSSQQDTWEQQRQDRDRKSKAWDGVRERALTMTAAALKQSGPTAPVIDALTKTMHFYGGGDGKLFKDLMGPVTAENVAIAMLFYRLVDDSREFDEFARMVKPFGVNLKAIEAEYRKAAAAPKAEKAPTAKASKAKGKKR